MREIKFRAWESLTSTLWQPHEIEVKFINDSHHVTVPRGDGYVTYHQFKNSPNPLILMQYTGLKDRNGVEIYEGDIHEYDGRLFDVKFGYYTEDDSYIEMYGWYLDSNILEYQGSLGVDSEKYVNIIGNIHDNPELVEGKNDQT